MKLRQINADAQPLSKFQVGEAFYYVGSLFIKTDERRERKEESVFDVGSEFCFYDTLVVNLSDGIAHYFTEGTPVFPVDCEIVYGIERSDNT